MKRNNPNQLHLWEAGMYTTGGFAVSTDIGTNSHRRIGSIST